MNVLMGKRYVCVLSGVEVIVTRGGSGRLCCGDQPLKLKDSLSADEKMTWDAVKAGNAGKSATMRAQLGKRYMCGESGIEVLVTTPGPVDLYCNAAKMEEKKPNAQPSAD